MIFLFPIRATCSANLIPLDLHTANIEDNYQRYMLYTATSTDLIKSSASALRDSWRLLVVMFPFSINVQTQWQDKEWAGGEGKQKAKGRRCAMSPRSRNRSVLLLNERMVGRTCTEIK
jgi:hypothetical protein